MLLITFLPVLLQVPVLLLLVLLLVLQAITPRHFIGKLCCCRSSEWVCGEHGTNQA